MDEIKIKQIIIGRIAAAMVGIQEIIRSHQPVPKFPPGGPNPPSQQFFNGPVHPEQKWLNDKRTDPR